MNKKGGLISLVIKLGILAAIIFFFIMLCRTYDCECIIKNIINSFGGCKL